MALICFKCVSNRCVAFAQLAADRKTESHKCQLVLLAIRLFSFAFILLQDLLSFLITATDGFITLSYQRLTNGFSNLYLALKHCMFHLRVTEMAEELLSKFKMACFLSISTE